jgi:hypothetical protein
VQQRLVRIAAVAGDMTQPCVHLRYELVVIASLSQGEGFAEVSAGRSCGTGVVCHPPGHLVERGGSSEFCLPWCADPNGYWFGDPACKIGRHSGVQMTAANSAVGQPERPYEVQVLVPRPLLLVDPGAGRSRVGVDLAVVPC